MKTGLLWYDDTPDNGLDEKIGRVVRRYKQKFGTAPDLCYVHPDTLDGDGPRRVGGVRVAALYTVLRNHFWCGVE